jgi:hypothetical protein
MNFRDEILEFAFLVIKITDRAVLIEAADSEEWLPLSQLSYDSIIEGEITSFEIPRWLAEEKGFV